MDAKKDARRDQTIQRVRFDCRIGVDGKYVLIERWIDTNDVLDLVVHLQLKRTHGGVEVNLSDAHRVSPFIEDAD